MSKEVQLYDLAGADPDVRFSPYCWRTRFALAHKGLAVRTIPWRFHESPALGFSGQNKVPVIVDGERTVHDSWTIALYLEQTYPDRPSLFGSSAAIPVTRIVNAWVDGSLHGRILPLVILPVYQNIAAEDQAYFRSSREARFKTTLENHCADSASHRERFHHSLEPLRMVLKQQTWLAGEKPGYADYIVAGSLQWPRVFLGAKLLDSKDPIAQWLDAVLSLHDGLGHSAKQAAC